MGLERYCGRRLISFGPDTRVHDAARAMRTSHVGAVVVEDHDRAIGIATDRDLAVRVLARGLSADLVSLKQVMTSDLVTLREHETEDDAATVMRDLQVRRVPIVDRHEKPTGMVTLDDLILAGLHPEQLAAVVRAQLEPRSVGAHPRHERALAALREFEGRMKAALEVADRDTALEAFYVVASGIVRRLTPAGAHDFISQLPALVRERLYELPPGPDRRVTLTSVDEDMAAALRLPFTEAVRLVDRVAAALPLFVSEGELEDVRAHLPWRMRKLIRLAA